MKPTLVMIGETHPDKAEDMFSFMDLLKRREISAISGRKRLIPVSGHPGTKLRVKHIVTDIIRREGDILKENGITKLMVELPRSQEYLSAFADYKKSMDLTGLKNRLYPLKHEKRHVEFGKAAEFVDGIQVSAQAKELVCGLLKAKAGACADIMPIFYLAQLNAAKRAGIFDIEPIEGYAAYAETISLHRLLFALPAAKRAICFATDLDWEKIADELGQIEKTACMRIASLNHEREKQMAKNIAENYAPGSAVLIGKEHLQRVARLLSGKFEVREYTVRLPDSILS